MGTPQCPGCNKLAGLDEPEVEMSSIDLTDNMFSVNVSIIRNSTCCGYEIKRADLDGEFEIDHTCTELPADEYDFEQPDDPSWEPYVKGGGRYAKSYVGATAMLETKCNGCGEQLQVPADLDIAAGDMDVSV